MNMFSVSSFLFDPVLYKLHVVFCSLASLFSEHVTLWQRRAGIPMWHKPMWLPSRPCVKQSEALLLTSALADAALWQWKNNFPPGSSKHIKRLFNIVTKNKTVVLTLFICSTQSSQTSQLWTVKLNSSSQHELSTVYFFILTVLGA